MKEILQCELLTCNSWYYILYGMGQFGAAVSAMDVSAMKCEMCFPLECHQSEKVRTAVVKRVDAKFGLALVPIVQQRELLSKHTYTSKNDADNQLHNYVCGARCLSRWRCYKYTCKITAEKND